MNLAQAAMPIKNHHPWIYGDAYDIELSFEPLNFPPARRFNCLLTVAHPNEKVKPGLIDPLKIERSFPQ